MTDFNIPLYVGVLPKSAKENAFSYTVILSEPPDQRTM
jgi:hypothetical protein